MYRNWNLLTQIDKVQEKKHLTVSFGCFLSTNLKKRFMKNQKAQNLKPDRSMKTCFACGVSLKLLHKLLINK